MNEKTIMVPNIKCGHCVATIKRELSELPGVSVLSAEPETKKVVIRFENPAAWAEITRTLSEIGYPAREQE